MPIAIVDDNVLSAIGLRHLLEGIIPMAEILLWHGLDNVDGQEAWRCAHYFVSSRIYLEHPQFFRKVLGRVIVLVGGTVSMAGVRTLNVCQDEKGLVRDILSLRSAGHGGPVPKAGAGILSEREIQVAVLLCKGYINKEVADALNISLTTVISHRRNIMAKLNARSLADIIVHVVMNGYVNIGEL